MPQPPDHRASLALNIDRLMRKIHAELHPKAVDFDQHKVGPLGGMLLLTLADREGSDLQTLSRALGRDKSQVSRLISRMENQGLLQRETSSSDGRSVELRLTAEGKAQLLSIEAALTATVDEVLGPLNPAEKKTLSTLLQKIALVDAKRSPR